MKLTRNAVEYNLIPYIQSGSTFFEIESGDNVFSYLADEGNDEVVADIKFKYYKKYLGV